MQSIPISWDRYPWYGAPYFLTESLLLALMAWFETQCAHAYDDALSEIVISIKDEDNALKQIYVQG